MFALRLLDLFKTSEQKIALVIDEYGGVQGLVTINDILETVAGTFSRVDEPGAIRRQDGSWLVDGLLPVDEFKEIISPAQLPDEDDAADYETVGGLVMARLRKIPSAGDRFEWGGLNFEVLDMDGRRVDKVLVTPSGRRGVPGDPILHPTERRNNEKKETR
jgi:putative hemolysin